MVVGSSPTVGALHLLRKTQRGTEERERERERASERERERERERQHETALPAGISNTCGDKGPEFRRDLTESGCARVLDNTPCVLAMSEV